jgi:hypothetical protein
MVTFSTDGEFAFTEHQINFERFDRRAGTAHAVQSMISGGSRAMKIVPMGGNECLA